MKKRKIGIYFFIITFIYGLYHFFDSFSKAEGANPTNVYQKLSAKENINYLIIGDSIGRGSGASSKSAAWFSRLERHLHNEYGIKSKRHSIVQSGATAFEGLYKLQQSEHFGKIDLTFIVFGENDRKYMDEKQFSYFYEGLIRKTKQLYPDTEIITITENPLDNEAFVQSISVISNHYGAKNVDMRIPFAQSRLPAEELTKDMVHPNDHGYKLYADSLIKKIRELTGSKAEIAVLSAPIQEDADFEITSIPHVTDISGSFIHKEGIWESSKAGDSLEYQFSGPFLGVNMIRSEKGGKMDVFIDDAYITSLSAWWPLTKERYQYIISGLDHGTHHVKFIVSDEKSVNNSTDDAVIQISSILSRSE
ncbi:SGNH/GDSL hydrolase family protein [Cytobacillus pseudoceanisediminis]|uniref:SGNH/GDSL hydrolase family protein n=1 Tax=Cytobacillus pseudoceanisediminis TaxID=3051614 RepID=UPI003C300395